MKRIKALIALICVCLTLTFTTASAMEEAQPTPSFVAFRLFSYYSLEDEKVPLQFAYAYDAPSGSLFRISLKSGDNELLLGEHVQSNEKNIRCFSVNSYTGLINNLITIIGETYVGSERFEYEIPMEFFEGDSGSFEILFERYGSDGEFHEKQGYPFDSLQNVAYRKSDGKIYFTLQQKEGEVN